MQVLVDQYKDEVSIISKVDGFLPRSQIVHFRTALQTQVLIDQYKDEVFSYPQN